MFAFHYSNCFFVFVTFFAYVFRKIIIICGKQFPKVQQSDGALLLLYPDWGVQRIEPRLCGDASLFGKAMNCICVEVPAFCGETRMALPLSSTLGRPNGKPAQSKMASFHQKTLMVKKCIQHYHSYCFVEGGNSDSEFSSRGESFSMITFYECDCTS